MGLLIDYFLAADDSEAASALDDEAFTQARTVDGSGIEPVVNLGMFEELLTGKTFQHQLDDPRSRPLVASADDDEAWVVAVAEPFVTALLGADDAELERLSVPWSQIEEFGGAAEPAVLAQFLVELRELARQGQQAHRRVYCRISL